MNAKLAAKQFLATKNIVKADKSHYLTGANNYFAPIIVPCATQPATGQQFYGDNRRAEAWH